MRYLSLFSGIEAATVAWEPLGWEAVGFAEIEPFPCALLKHYYPQVPNLGSVTEITEGMIKKLGPIDLVVFGSPCQDLSVAGKRKGFEGERSGLFYDAVRIIRWARKHGGCRFALWENVPGAFSSNQGKDFAEVVRLLSGFEFGQEEKCPNSGVAFGKEGAFEWRVLDAQYFGVPQRRRRIFALTDFGDWTGRPPILFESEGLFGDFAAGRASGEDAAGKVGESIAAGGGRVKGSHWDDPDNPHPTLNQSHNAGGIAQSDQELFAQRGAGLVGTWWDGSQLAQTIDCSTVVKRQTMPDKNRFAAVLQPEDEVWPADKTCTLPAAFSDKLGLEDQYINSGASLFVESKPYDFQGIAQYGEGETASTQAANSHYKSLSDLVVVNPKDDPITSDNALPLQAQTNGASNAVAIPIHDQATRFSGKRGENQDGKGNGLGIGADGDPANTLTSGDKHAVAYQLSGGGKRKDRPEGGLYVKEADVSMALDTSKGLEPSCNQGGMAVATSSEAELAIRRLTPVECERLQGFPDFYTAIPWKNKPAEECPDGPRYKALGNSMAVPVMFWIGWRLDKVIGGKA